jgi:DNA-binding SARP family transcriptional activator
VSSYLDAEKLPCIWYRMDEGDGDISSFYYYMGLAVRKAAPRKKKPMPLLTPEYMLGIPVFTRRYFEELYERIALSRSSRFASHGFALVFDNFQDVPQGSALQQSIIHGFDEVSDGMIVIVASRTEPPSEFARLLADGKVELVGWNDMKLSLEESRDIIRMRGWNTLKEDDEARLCDKAGGWAAGLVLMTEALRNDVNLLRSAKLSPEAVFDYFAGEVFDNFDRETQEFLMKTSFFPGMDGPMAAKLTGSGNSAEILSRLNRSGYFTERLYLTAPVFRYHPLFIDFLQLRAGSSYSTEEFRDLRSRAASLLIESGRAEDAVPLLREAADWERLTGLILEKAPELLSGGRVATLMEWIESIPSGIVEATPWLLYWLGVCNLPLRQTESRNYLERAFRLFDAAGEASGTLLAWSGAVESIMFGWDDFKLLDFWIDWLDDRMKNEHAFPSIEIETRVSLSMAGALVWRRPQHPDMQKWMERALSLARKAGDPGILLQACLYAANYYIWMGDVTNIWAVKTETREIASSPHASRLTLLTWKWLEAATYIWPEGLREMSLESLAAGMAIADAEGIYVWNHMLFAYGAYGALIAKDKESADQFLGKMETLLKKDKRQGYCQYNYIAAWYNLLFGTISRALYHAEVSLKFAIETGMFFPELLCRLEMGHLLCQQGDFQAAKEYLESAYERAVKSGSLIMQYMALMAKARLALERNDDSSCLELLRDAMALGRRGNFTSMFWWCHPPVMARLCSKALVAGIEPEYVRNLIRRLELPPEGLSVENSDWPWPLKIYTLGKFELMKDDSPLRFSRKVRQKPLQLIKALVVSGRGGSREEQLADSLWPDADGDAAYSAFTTTLSRLRQLLGDERQIVSREGMFMLNPSYCWVDAWAFERQADKMEEVLRTVKTANASTRTPAAGSKALDLRGEIEQLAEATMSFYKGPFLPADEGLLWTASYRERLRLRYVGLIRGMANYVGGIGEWEKAAEYYERAIGVDEHAEELYRSLMSCHLNSGHRSRAMAVYERCRKMLFASFEILPEEKTEAVYKKILNSR